MNSASTEIQANTTDEVRRSGQRKLWKFHGGVHPKFNKEMSNQTPIKHIKLPRHLIVPLRQSLGTIALPIVDTGDYVIVVNADKIRFTGNKMSDKVYLRYSGYPGGQKAITAENLMAKKPIAVVETAVKGMLPKNILGRAMYKKLFVYAGPDHPHQAQKPEPFKF